MEGTSSTGIEDDDEGEEDDVESLTCVGCAEEKDCCHCAKIIEGFSQLNSQLHSLGLMKKVAEPAFLSVIHSEVNSWYLYIDTNTLDAPYVCDGHCLELI